MVETAEAKQVCNAASTLLFPKLDFGVKQCGKYTREDFLEILSRIAFDQEFANTGGKTLQLDREQQVDITSTARNSLAKSLLYHLRNLSTDAIDSSKSSEHSGDFPRSSMSPSIFMSSGSTAQPTLTT